MTFKTFLMVYGGFLLLHLSEVKMSAGNALIIFLGLGIAILAHKRHGFLPLMFLIGHMIIEWHHHSVHGHHYHGDEIVFHGVHAILDGVFLYVEAKEHFKGYAYYFLGGVVIVLMAIFTHTHIPVPHSDHGGILEYLVMGGMMGCVLSHLLLAPRLRRAH